MLLNNFDSASDKDMVVSIVLASCHSTEGESVAGWDQTMALKDTKESVAPMPHFQCLFC